MIDLTGEIADGDAGLDRCADAGREPAGEQQCGQRRDEHGGAEPEIHVVLQGREQRGRAGDLDACLLNPPRTVGRVDIGKRERRTDDELARVGPRGIARQGQRYPQLRVAREAQEKR